MPIFGSCSTTTDIPGIGEICYPSYNLNATGPGVMLASYTSADFGLRFASLTEEAHVQYVLNAMIEIHGDVARDQYTGKYNRRCWVLDPLESASWASPSIGMHKLYIPVYFKTENNVSDISADYYCEPADFGTDDICWGTYQVSSSNYMTKSIPALVRIILLTRLELYARVEYATSFDSCLRIVKMLTNEKLHPPWNLAFGEVCNCCSSSAW